MSGAPLPVPALPPAPGRCPLCATPVAPADDRCPECGMSLSGIDGRPGPYSTAARVWTALGIVACFLVALVVVLAAR